MKVLKVTSDKWTKEQLNHQRVELDIHDGDLTLEGVWRFESWTHPEGDGIFVAVRSDFGAELPQHSSPNAISQSTVCFPQGIVDLIERHPDQKVAAFRIRFSAR